MFISHKSNQLLAVDQLDWKCRRKTKKMNRHEYQAWEKTITDKDGNVDYSGETDYTIVECADENAWDRISSLGTYVDADNTTFNIKWQDVIGDAEEILDIHGKSFDPKRYVQSHFVPDDEGKAARLLAEEWRIIRIERDRLLGQTDWMMLSDTGTVSTAWKNYRKALREIPQSQDSAKIFEDIDWPDKPSS